VAECAAVSSPDEFRGSVIKAFIVLRTEFIKSQRDGSQEGLEHEIQEHVKLQTAPYKYPRKVLAFL
jgi:acetyl-CoA synthetase